MTRSEEQEETVPPDTTVNDVDISKIRRENLIFEDHYKLKGHFNEVNNFDDFSWWLELQFGDLGLWTKNGLASGVSPYVILRNIDSKLHSHYRSIASGADLYDTLCVNYSRQSSSSRAMLLSELVKKRYTLDMDAALNDFEKTERLLLASFGTTIDTKILVQILFIQSIPDYYENARLAAITSPNLDFDGFRKYVQAMWTERKYKAESKVLQATPSSVAATGNLVDEIKELKLKLKALTGKSEKKCPEHPKWEFRNGIDTCLLCSSCQKCLEKGFRNTWHTEGSKSCASSFAASGGKAKLATAGWNGSAVVDSGSTNHLVTNKVAFETYTASQTSIETANGSYLTAIGHGAVTIGGANGPLRLQTALHTPELSESTLLSVHQFDLDGFASIFCDGMYTLLPAEHIRDFIVTQKGNAVLEGSFDRIAGLYTIPVGEETRGNKSCMASSASRTSTQWHLALNHPSTDRMIALGKGSTTGFILLDRPAIKCNCDSCFLGKSKQLPYAKKSSTVVASPGDLISVDGFGRLPVCDWNGNYYYMAFIDHCSGKSFVYLYSSPGQVAQIVVDFLIEVSTFLGHPVKTLRFDREGGYMSLLVSDYCRTVGTRLEPTLADAHQQNGTSENFNLHCLEGVRTMLAQSNLSFDLWGEAVLNYSYTRNKLPSRGCKRTPDEVWYNKPQDIHHLRAFGEPCFPHIMPKDQKSKLHARSSKAIFLGYDLHTKAYRLLDSDTHSLILSRSVQFYSDYKFPPMSVSRFADDVVPIVPPDPDYEDSNFGDMETSNPYSALEDDNGAFETTSDVFEDASDVLLLAETTESDFGSEVAVGVSSNGGTNLGASVPPNVVNDASSVTTSNIIGNVSEGIQTRSSRNRVLKSSSPVSLVNDPPKQYRNIGGRSDAAEWYAAARKERRGIVGLGCVKVVRRPKGKRVIRNRYVFTRKIDGTAKARVVLKDIVKDGEPSTYSPVAEDASFKMLCTVAATEDMDMEQFDVTQAFLHAEMDEETYTELPDGWELPAGLDPLGDYVLKVEKALYGHRRAPFLWYEDIRHTLELLGMKVSDADACVFVKLVNSTRIYLILHVDDFIIASNDAKEKAFIVDTLKERYSLKQLGEVNRYTNYQVSRNRVKKEIYLHQQDYIAELLEMSGMGACAASASKGQLFVDGLQVSRKEEEAVESENGIAYRTLTGALIHLCCHSRPDISYEVVTLCKYNSKPTSNHWEALKQLLRYLKYTANYCLTLGGTSDMILQGFADSGFATDHDTGRSPGGFVFYLGKSLICHKSSWFKSVYVSSTEAEIAAIYLATSMALWLKKLVLSMGLGCSAPILIHEDNQGAIKYCSTLEKAGRMKHIQVKFHWIREKIIDRSIALDFVSTTQNVADIMTKTLKGQKLANFCRDLGFGCL